MSDAPRLCSIEGCSAPHVARGYCNRHWKRARSAGTFVAGWPSPEERFWSKVDKDAPVPEFAPHLGPCWWWKGYLMVDVYGNRNYGQFVIREKKFLAHRLAYEWLVGPIPEGLQMDHLCRVQRCVRPSHLEPVTNQENARRGYWGMKTHCPRGHPYDEANTHTRSNGSRICRTCARELQRQRRAKQRSAA